MAKQPFGVIPAIILGIIVIAFICGIIALVIWTRSDS